jgi:hypothetical protein
MREDARPNRLPDFYAIGAPRCGTTAIYDVLRRQPRIFVPKKEPKFWCDDLDSGSAADGLFFMRSFEDYAALYAPAGSEQVVGDMSTWYLLSQNAVPRILGATPNVRLIVGVRNPVDLMQSLHAMRVAGLSEDLVDFRTALAAEDERLRGHRIPPNVRNRSGLLYRRVASLGSQLQRLAARVPMHQVYVYVYEEFRNDPRTILNGILGFFEMPPLAAGEPIPVLNRRTAVRRLPLRTLLMAPRTVIWAKRIAPAPIRRALRQVVNAATLRRESGAAKLSDAERWELLESFRADIELVSEFTGRDMWALWSSPSN